MAEGGMSSCGVGLEADACGYGVVNSERIEAALTSSLSMGCGAKLLVPLRTATALRGVVMVESIRSMLCCHDGVGFGGATWAGRCGWACGLYCGGSACC